MRQLKYALLNVTQRRDYNTNLISFTVRHQCHHRHLGQLQLGDFRRVFFIFDAILGGWGGGRGASIRQGAFIREGCLLQTIHLKGGVY